jgi:hypothetical protein
LFTTIGVAINHRIENVVQESFHLLLILPKFERHLLTLDVFGSLLAEPLVHDECIV